MCIFDWCAHSWITSGVLFEYKIFSPYLRFHLLQLQFLTQVWFSADHAFVSPCNVHAYSKCFPAVTSPMTLNFYLWLWLWSGLGTVKVNWRARYLGQRSFQSKINCPDSCAKPAYCSKLIIMYSLWHCAIHYWWGVGYMCLVCFSITINVYLRFYFAVFLSRCLVPVTNSMSCMSLCNLHWIYCNIC